MLYELSGLFIPDFVEYAFRSDQSSVGGEVGEAADADEGICIENGY